MSDGKQKGGETMRRVPRALHLLEAATLSIEELVSRSNAPLASQRKAERMLGDLMDIERSMKKLDVTNSHGRKRFWKKERRAVALSMRIARLLSTS